MKNIRFVFTLIMAISLLVGCNNVSDDAPTHKIYFDGGEYLTIDTTECREQTDLLAKISVKNEYLGNYEVPQNKAYYEVTRNSETLKNFEIIEDDSFNSIYLKIPKEEITSDIAIKTEGYCHYLTFTGVEDDEAIIKYSFKNWPDSNPISAPTPIIKYTKSLDNPKWKVWELSTTISLKQNESIYIKNDINTFSSESNYYHFETNDRYQPQVAASGNVMSLVNFSALSDCCFTSLFYNCGSLISAPILPATTLTNECYRLMFSKCVLLKSAPILPATTLAKNCYLQMFQLCSALVNAPQLPATTLAYSCYGDMFDRCISLISAPQLPATTLMDFCYCGMFNLCINLKINNEYHGVRFFKCPTGDLPEACVVGMFFETGGSYQGNDPVPGETYCYE
ncbi:MAG: hypothetical protein MJ214_03725 [Bacilli bacterium]|nr:hypothetical protein [Bacilli bacterium]